MSETAKEKMAPVQGYTPGIPWSLHLEAYDVYSRKWAPQPALIDLEGRGCRGGFSTGELDEFIPGWRDRASELVHVKAQRDELLLALKDVLAAVRYSSRLPETVMQFEEKLDRIKAASKRANSAIAKAEGGAA